MAEKTGDEALDDLLDSALKDFNNINTTDKACAKNFSERTKDTGNVTADTPMDHLEAIDFIKQAAEQFQQELQTSMQNGTDPEVAVAVQKVAQAVADAVKDEGVDDGGETTEFGSVVTQALVDLYATSASLQNEADLSKMFEQVSLEDGPDSFVPFMQSMLQHFLSKDILYPTLKELVDKYPEWIEEKKATIPSQDLQRFTKQLELLQQVCAQLEKESEGDSSETKKKRFEAIISLMQQVQAYGQIPEELTGEQSAFSQGDAAGDFPLPPFLRNGAPLQQNCSLM